MPFTIQKNKKKEFCVFKKNEKDDKPMGESLGCHKAKKDAVAQIGTIESELKRRGKKSTGTYNFYINSEAADFPQEESTTVWGMSKDYSVYTDREEDMSEQDNAVKAKHDDDDDDDDKSKDKDKTESFDSFDDAAKKAKKLGCFGAHKLPDGKFLPCSKHKEYLELVNKKSIEVNEDTLQLYIDDDDEWLVEVSSGLIKSFITNNDNSDDSESGIDPRFAVKSLGENRLGAYGVLWGDDENQDLHEEHFTKKTKDMTAIFDAMGKIPLVVHHAADDKVKTFVYGEVDVMELDDIGLWYEAKIKEFETYRRYVQPFLNDKKLFSSSGTLPAAKRVKKSGEIVRWPIAEMTTTWMPAEYRMLERPVSEIKSIYKEMGLDCDLSEYDNETQEPDTKGAEKARLKAMVDYHLSELGLLEIEI